MKIYVVMIDISYDYDNSIFVEVFKDRAKAKEYMLKQFEQEIKETGYNIIEREDDILSAYEEGYFPKNHCEIKLLEKEIKK